MPKMTNEEKAARREARRIEQERAEQVMLKMLEEEKEKWKAEYPSRISKILTFLNKYPSVINYSISADASTGLAFVVFLGYASEDEFKPFTDDTFGPYTEPYMWDDLNRAIKQYIARIEFDVRQLQQAKDLWSSFEESDRKALKRWVTYLSA